MTSLQSKFVKQKRREFQNQLAMFGDVALDWDQARFLTIIAGLEREIRRLKTELNVKERT